MNQGTLIFFVRRDEQSNISEVCLAMKKRDFGKDKWNGIGGKVGDKWPETIRESACREVKEEVNLDVEKNQLRKVAELDFIFDGNDKWSQVVNVFLIEEWDGEPTESEEMRPEWFDSEKVPYDSMWEDDKHWLPIVLKDNLVKGRFVFSTNGEELMDVLVNVVDEMEEDNSVFER